MTDDGGRLHRFVAAAARRGELVVQPRMGYSDPAGMRAGLAGVRAADAVTVGTITLDSFTRLGDHRAARAAVAAGGRLNGYPLVAHGPVTTRQVVAGLHGDDFPIQVRHGSPRPEAIFATLARTGLDATEGGPVSYCLPYSRDPVDVSVAAWRRCCEAVAAASRTVHLETFGGCLLGQLCPPGLLLAVSVLEAMFFREHGVHSVSVSYAQQAHLGQDIAAVRALRRLATEHLAGARWHLVVYTYMGVYPRTAAGALRLVRRSVLLAALGGAERLIVKTAAEAHGIPTIADNITALEHAAGVHRGLGDLARLVPDAADPDETEEIYREAAAIVGAVRDLAPDLGTALARAVRAGIVDVPFCLHPDNANRSRAELTGAGRLRWVDPGSMPVRVGRTGSPPTAAALLTMLHAVRSGYDGTASTPDPRTRHVKEASTP